MFGLYANFLMEIIAPKEGETNITESSSHGVNYISHLLSLCERAESMGCITEDLAFTFVTLHLQIGQLDEARKLAERLCDGKHAKSVQLWGLRVTIEIRCITRSSSPSDADLLSLFELLRQILTKVPVSESEDLWLQVCCHPQFLIFVFYIEPCLV